MNSLIISLFVEFYKVLIIKSGPSKKDEMEIHNLQDFIPPKRNWDGREFVRPDNPPLPKSSLTASLTRLVVTILIFSVTPWRDVPWQISLNTLSYSPTPCLARPASQTTDRQTVCHHPKKSNKFYLIEWEPENDLRQRRCIF